MKRFCAYPWLTESCAQSAQPYAPNSSRKVFVDFDDGLTGGGADGEENDGDRFRESAEGGPDGHGPGQIFPVARSRG